MTSRDHAGMSPDGAAGPVVAVTLDFGNTLVPVSRDGLMRVVDATGRAVSDRYGPFPLHAFREAWREERERQFREEIPRFREPTLAARFVRVLARLRGMGPPPADAPWDDDAAARRSDPQEVAWALERYTDAFVATLPPAPWVDGLLERLAATRLVAILSNWPHAATIDRYAEAAGWLPFLSAIVVSQRVGAIKPHPAIFAAAREALGSPPPSGLLHAGDDWVADVVGAKRAGWRAAFVDSRPPDSPLPAGVRDDSVAPDIVIDSVDALDVAIGGLEARHG
jgi:FMN phosphatase YigB (HAD superfamily)